MKEENINYLERMTKINNLQKKDLSNVSISSYNYWNTISMIQQLSYLNLSPRKIKTHDSLIDNIPYQEISEINKKIILGLSSKKISTLLQGLMMTNEDIETSFFTKDSSIITKEDTNDQFLSKFNKITGSLLNFLYSQRQYNINEKNIFIHPFYLTSNNLDLVESIIRCSKIIAFDCEYFNPSKTPDSPAIKINTEQLLKIAKMIGNNIHNKIIVFYNHDISKDKEEETSKIIAEMIWYINEGSLMKPSVDFEYYDVQKDADIIYYFKHDIVYKKWWVSLNKNKWIPITINEYLSLLDDEITDHLISQIEKYHD